MIKLVRYWVFWVICDFIWLVLFQIQEVDRGKWLSSEGYREDFRGTVFSLIWSSSSSTSSLFIPYNHVLHSWLNKLGALKNFFFNLRKSLKCNKKLKEHLLVCMAFQNTRSSHFFVQLIKSQKKRCWGHSKCFSNAFFMLLMNDMVTILRMFCLLL